MLDHTAATDLLRDLGQLPELITRAHLALVPGSGPAGPRVSGATRTPPLPCRLDALSVLGPTSLGGNAYPEDQADHPTVRILPGWARLVIARRQAANDWSGWLRPPYVRADEAEVSLAVRYLVFHHDWIVRQDFARTYADQVGRLHSALNLLTAEPIAPARPTRMVCPRCQLLSMTEEPDGRRVCADPGCWVVLTRDEYERRAEHVLEDRAAA